MGKFRREKHQLSEPFILGAGMPRRSIARTQSFRNPVPEDVTIWRCSAEQKLEGFVTQPPIRHH
jgi:hypothetical protein